MRIFCRSESFLGDKSLRGLAGSGSTHWYERARMLCNRVVSAVCIIAAIFVCERVRIWCMRSETVTVSSAPADGSPAGESFPLFENETVGEGDKTFFSISSSVATLRGRPGRRECASYSGGGSKEGGAPSVILSDVKCKKSLMSPEDCELK